MREVREKEREIVFALLVFLDQLTKLLSFRLGLASINRGVSFGIVFPFACKLDFTQCSTVLSLLVFLVLTVVFYFKRGRNLGLLLVFVGGVSNLIDRLVYGGVVDFISLSLIPAFNLADVLIVVGIIWVFVDAVGGKKL